jgi:hypothetical protein
MHATIQTPAKRAQALRAEAAGQSGQKRDYLLWLAAEWDKTAAREARAGKKVQARDDLRGEIASVD